LSLETNADTEIFKQLIDEDNDGLVSLNDFRNILLYKPGAEEGLYDLPK